MTAINDILTSIHGRELGLDKNRALICPGGFIAPAGAGAAAIAQAGLVFATAVSTGNGADTTDDTLATFSLPANSLNANNKVMRIRAWGVTAANGNNKTIKLFFGATNLSSGVVTSNNKSWSISMDVIRSGTSTQATYASCQVDTSVVAPAYQAATETDTAAIVIKATGASGTTGAANDVVLKGMTIEFLN
jgi:hypothetical protein